MPAIKLDAALRDEYQKLFDTCAVRAERAAGVDAIVGKMLANRARYETASRSTNVPWYVIAAIHAMESAMSFSKHLHNGDPLTARTVQVPAGRPKSGAPPFTWEVSADDALRLRKLHLVTDWTVPGMLFQVEGYNGWGYRQYHPETKSPYLWSFSSHYSKGKYVADGKWSTTAVSGQCGAAVMIKRLVERGDAVLPTPPPAAPSGT
ncbi:MAG: hypothetical protein FJW39_22025 [Acidobacteria bacterium]|nr:hypothetical protein [Acidobacteriota bacterium]